ncbi:hypothetical protein A0130_02605 [Leifsonia xyli]|uniref:hypothetical protein n=1 Tax=Leifsonia xyli TaxID=1575 RepID=UPI0007CDA53E|nr:hypothetical protein A0130_02605 [Leifsonia xyli]
MTVDPSTPEGRPRTRRGIWVVAAVLVFFVLQGLLYRWALTTGSPGAWVSWALFVAAAAAGFVVESLAERRRRRQR